MVFTMQDKWGDILLVWTCTDAMIPILFNFCLIIVYFLHNKWKKVIFFNFYYIYLTFSTLFFSPPEKLAMVDCLSNILQY